MKLILISSVSVQPPRRCIAKLGRVSGAKSCSAREDSTPRGANLDHQVLPHHYSPHKSESPVLAVEVFEAVAIKR